MTGNGALSAPGPCVLRQVVHGALGAAIVRGGSMHFSVADLASADLYITCFSIRARVKIRSIVW